MADIDVDALIGRLTGDILDAVPDDNDMQHALELAADALSRLRDERNALAAVIEKAQEVGRQTGYSPHKEPVMKALSTAPAGALREHEVRFVEGMLSSRLMPDDVRDYLTGYLEAMKEDTDV